MTFGVLGNGSWGTAIVKILSDNNNDVHWWQKSAEAAEHIAKRQHNPNYLSSAFLNTSRIRLSTELAQIISATDVIIIAVPSAYVRKVLEPLAQNVFAGKKIVSAVKGILPEEIILLNDFLRNKFGTELKDYFALMGPCHAEEIAAERLSYLTVSGIDTRFAEALSKAFHCEYVNTIVNKDIYGVQYAAVLKNIYAIGAGIAHGLDYGDNFLSVLIANSADEMAGFLRIAGIMNAEVGYLDYDENAERADYAASVYLGDLLVTCYSLHSRNRSFGNMIGKGYSVKNAQLEMNMVAEGYNASKCMYIINQQVKAEMPIADGIYRILWEGKPAAGEFELIEKTLV